MSFADLMHRAMGFLGVTKDFQALGPFWGAIFGALLTSGVVGGVVHARTKRHQEAMALFEFDKRFHDLADFAHRLSRDFKGATMTEAATAEAGVYYRKLFDLMFNEYHFFRQGFVGKDTFSTWMAWRWGAWHDIEGATLTVGGVAYQDAWRRWSTRPLMKASPFVRFIDGVHAAPNIAAVNAAVAKGAPPWWRL